MTGFLGNITQSISSDPIDKCEVLNSVVFFYRYIQSEINGSQRKDVADNKASSSFQL